MRYLPTLHDKYKWIIEIIRLNFNFGTMSIQSWDVTVLVNPQNFHLYHFFQNYEFSEKFAKSKSIILTCYFNTLIFKL